MQVLLPKRSKSQFSTSHQVVIANTVESSLRAVVEDDEDEDDKGDGDDKLVEVCPCLLKRSSRDV